MIEDHDVLIAKYRTNCTDWDRRLDFTDIQIKGKTVQTVIDQTVLMAKYRAGCIDCDRRPDYTVDLI